MEKSSRQNIPEVDVLDEVDDLSLYHFVLLLTNPLMMVISKQCLEGTQISIPIPDSIHCSNNLLQFCFLQQNQSYDLGRQDKTENVTLEYYL